MAFAKATTLASGTLGAAAATLLTIAAASAAYVRVMRLRNKSGAAVTLTIWKQIAAVDYVLWTGSLGAGERVEGNDIVIGATEVIRGQASAAAAIDYLIEGVIET